MKNPARLVLAGVITLFLVVVVWAVPPITNYSNSFSAAAIEQASAQTQSATGTISAIDKSSFTLTLQPGGNVNAAVPVASQTSPKSMTFLVDKNTTIEGKLQVGANAEVTYHDDTAGNHLALGVRVTAPKM